MLVTAAILEHIGNKKMAVKLLSKSNTVTKYYDKMGLRNDDIREMYVTVLFCLSPSFVKMVETSIGIAIERSRAMGIVKKNEDEVQEALMTMAETGQLSPNELIRSSRLDHNLDCEDTPRTGRLSIQTTPTEMIAPSDSASVVVRHEKTRPRVNEKDLMNYIGRRKSGNEPNYEDIFPRSKPPISIDNKFKNNRRGIGFINNEEAPNSYASRMNRILGSMSVKSYNITSGDVRSRKPTVEDYLEGDSASMSAYVGPPDLQSAVDWEFPNGKPAPPSPTDFGLPNSVYEMEITRRRQSVKKDSLEMLYNAFNKTDIKQN